MNKKNKRGIIKNIKIDNLTEIIDEYLKRFGIVIKKDIGKHKKLGILNYIGWGFVGLFIFLDVVIS